MVECKNVGQHVRSHARASRPMFLRGAGINYWHNFFMESLKLRTIGEGLRTS